MFAFCCFFIIYLALYLIIPYFWVIDLMSEDQFFNT